MQPNRTLWRDWAAGCLTGLFEADHREDDVGKRSPDAGFLDARSEVVPSATVDLDQGDEPGVGHDRSLMVGVLVRAIEWLKASLVGEAVVQNGLSQQRFGLIVAGGDQFLRQGMDCLVGGKRFGRHAEPRGGWRLLDGMHLPLGYDSGKERL